MNNFLYLKQHNYLEDINYLSLLELSKHERKQLYTAEINRRNDMNKVFLP